MAGRGRGGAAGVAGGARGWLRGSGAAARRAGFAAGHGFAARRRLASPRGPATGASSRSITIPSYAGALRVGCGREHDHAQIVADAKRARHRGRHGESPRRRRRRRLRALAGAAARAAGCAGVRAARAPLRGGTASGAISITSPAPAGRGRRCGRPVRAQLTVLRAEPQAAAARPARRAAAPSPGPAPAPAPAVSASPSTLGSGAPGAALALDAILRCARIFGRGVDELAGRADRRLPGSRASA